ncbi:hypothetical protein ACTXT7_003950 [Hymenolepis weldensis]
MIGHPLTETMILRRAQKERLEKVKRVNLWHRQMAECEFLVGAAPQYRPSSPVNTSLN